jgi:hypothetical protein
MRHNICRCNLGLPCGKRPRAASKRWLEGAPEYVIDVFDGGVAVADRFTVFFRAEDDTGYVSYLGLSPAPTSPQGFSQWGHIPYHNFARYRRTAQRQRIRWGDLPENVRDHVRERAEACEDGFLRF